jgi:uncharacterized surface protein with fasciclin (FAS1) repeats
MKGQTMKKWLFLLLFSYGVGLAQNPVSVGTFISVNEGFSTLSQALETSGLMATLKDASAVTLFAPTNKAFAALPAARREALFADPTAMRTFLSKLVVPQKLLTSDLAATGQASTLGGSVLGFSSLQDGNILINGRTPITVSNVGTTGLTVSNGVVQVIDSLEGF